jgi:hypothetical protein
MNANEKKRLAVAVGVLGESFGREVTGITIRAYELGLEGIIIDEIEKAVSRAIAEKKFMPVPSEVRELAGDIPPADRAIKAWAIVMQQIGRYDYYNTMLFDDPIINATIRNLWRNWIVFCDALEKEGDKWMRKDFERVYISLMRSGVGQDGTTPLLGWTENNNRKLGYEIKPPVLVNCGLPKLPMLFCETKQPLKADRAKLLEGIGKSIES